MRKTIALAVVAMATALLAGAALAHTSIAESEPADNSTIEALPAEVSIRFGNAQIPAPQPAQLTEAALLVLDACGARIDNDDEQWDDTTSTITVTTTATSAAGRYEMHWSGKSTDGDSQAGVVDFVVSGGYECKSVVRDDPASDIDAGFDPTKVTSKPTATGAAVTVALKEAPACKSFKPATGRLLNVDMDTNWDEGVDYSGTFSCRMKKVRKNGVVRKVPVYGLAVMRAGGEAPFANFKVRKTAAKALTVSVPSSILEGPEDSLDLYVSSTTESDECAEDASCADRAPDLGWVRAL